MNSEIDQQVFSQKEYYRLDWTTMENENEIQTGTPLEEPINRLSISSRSQRIPSAFKLGHEGDSVPDHFRNLMNNTIIDRWRSIKSKTLRPVDFPPEYDALCCVTLTIALEEGFRLDESHPTGGFDMRVLEQAKTMPNFRMPSKTYKMSLTLPRVPGQFTMVVFPISKNLCTMNFMVSGEKSNGLTYIQSRAVPLSHYIKAIDTCVNMSNLRYLASYIRALVVSVKHQAFYENKLVQPNTLVGLPEDLQITIFKFLTVQAFLRLCSSSVFFEGLYQHHEWIWRYYLKRDFNSESKNSPRRRSLSAREQYKQLFRRSRRKCATSQTSSFVTNFPPRREYSEHYILTPCGLPMRSISEVAGGSASTGRGGGSSGGGGTSGSSGGGSPEYFMAEVDESEGSDASSDAEANGPQSRNEPDQESETPEELT